MTTIRRSAELILLFAAVAVLRHDGAHAQQNTITGYNHVLGQWDASQAARTNNSRTGAGSPVNRDVCLRPGESYFQTDASPGQNIWFCTAAGSPGTWTNGISAAGTVTSVACGTFGATWLTCSFGGSPATTPSLVLNSATGQTSHQVIGTCGSATSFAPCRLSSAELPLADMGVIAGGVWNGTPIARGYGGLNSSVPGTGILRDGTTPSASELSGACTTNGSNVVSCPPGGGGIPGGVAAITSTAGPINTTETTVVSYTIPANTIQAGTTYRVTAYGLCTSSAANTENFYVRLGTTGTSSDTAIGGTTAITAATSGTGVNNKLEYLVVFRSVSVSEVSLLAINSGSTGCFTSSINFQSALNTAGLTTTNNLVLQLSYVSAATTTTYAATNAVIELIKP
ncbi:MAG TPA: hypothetical protein VMI94_27960 [Bryobacteraceae bacterium]|nr:hypothetical protein [Bryobacteraceae bacterium]